jgi:Fur family transcriptional regulator, ferric uptake regulator
MVKRNTKQREEVWNVLERTPGFVSAQVLHQELQRTGSSVGLATVYRALNALADEGAIDALSIDGENLYRACSPGHHHHLICRVCGVTQEIEASEVESWAKRVAADHGYLEPQHIVDIFGVCPSCHAGLPAGQ